MRQPFHAANSANAPAPRHRPITARPIAASKSSIVITLFDTPDESGGPATSVPRSRSCRPRRQHRPAKIRAKNLQPATWLHGGMIGHVECGEVHGHAAYQRNGAAVKAGRSAT